MEGMLTNTKILYLFLVSSPNNFNAIRDSLRKIFIDRYLK